MFAKKYYFEINNKPKGLLWFSISHYRKTQIFWLTQHVRIIIVRKKINFFLLKLKSDKTLMQINFIIIITIIFKWLKIAYLISHFSTWFLSPIRASKDCSLLYSLLTRWTWVWVGSRSWWWTGKPGMMQSMGSQSRTLLSNWTDSLLLYAYCQA